MVVVPSYTVCSGHTSGFESAGRRTAQEGSESWSLVHRHPLEAIANAYFVRLVQIPIELGVEAGRRLREWQLGRIVVRGIAKWRVWIQSPIDCGRGVHLLQDRQ